MVLNALQGLVIQSVLRLNRSPWHTGFQHKLTRELLWLNRQPMWVESQIATRMQRFLWVGSARPRDEVQNLCSEGQLDKAMGVLLTMDQEGTVPSFHTYGALLKACGEAKSLAQAKLVYAHLVKHGLHFTTFLGEYIVSTLVKCAGIEDAVQVFQHLPHRSVFSWTAMITGYTMAGRAEEALRLYDWMHEDGVQPNTYTFVSLFKACASISNLKEGKRIHAEAIKYRCASDLFVGTCLVNMYAKCGSIGDAQNVFDGLFQRNVVSWTALLAAFVQQGDAEKVLQLYEQMWEEGVSPDVRAFVSTLQACGQLAEKEEGSILDGQSVKVKALEKGRAIHADAWKKAYGSDVFLGSTLISIYAKCGSLVDSEMVFDRMCQQNVVAWTALLAANVLVCQVEKALHLYEQMQEEGISPNDRTSVSVLQACGMLAEDEDVDGRSIKVKSLEKGKAIHADTVRKGFDADVFVSSSLISMYSKCGSMIDGQNVFDQLAVRNVVSWNAMLAGYVENAQAEKVLQLYERMREEGMTPDVRTFVSVLQACGTLAEDEAEDCFGGRHSFKTRNLDKGKALHADAVTMGYTIDVFVCNTLISMYAKCGSIVDAQKVFHELSVQNVVSWNAMLAAYVEQNEAEKALQLFEEMQMESVSINEVTLLSVLRASSYTGSLDICRRVHQYLVFTGKDLSPLLSTTLIHAYGSCASMEDAQNVFDTLPEPGVVSWNALVAGYARAGNSTATLLCYEQMRLAGVKPDGVTFLSLLSACSHAGLVESGVEYFESMSQDHGLSPEMEHYACMVDLLGRAGCFERVRDLLSAMPMQATPCMWLCLLGACRKHHKLVLGEYAFNSAVHLQPKDPAAYVLLSNIYADSGLSDSSNDVHELRQRAGAWKRPGQSWIGHENGVQTFLAGHRKLLAQEEVYELLGKICWKVPGRATIMQTSAEVV